MNINGNQVIATILNFVIGVSILVLGCYLLEVPSSENIFQLAQHMVGLVLIWFGADFDMFKGAK